VTDIRITPREAFLLPGMLPLDYTHRVSHVDREGHLHWQWFTNPADAHVRYVHLLEVARLTHELFGPGWVLGEGKESHG
jgi:hypothetical protein